MLNPHLVLLITAATAWWTGMSVLALRFPINLTRIRRSSIECDEDGADHLSDIYGKVVSDAISVRLYAYLQDMESRLMRRQDLVLQQIKKQIEEELLVIKDTSNRKGEDNNLQSFKEQERSLRTSWHGDDMTTINNLVIPAAMLLAIGLFVVQLSSFFNQSFHDRMPPYH